MKTHQSNDERTAGITENVNGHDLKRFRCRPSGGHNHVLKIDINDYMMI